MLLVLPVSFVVSVPDGTDPAAAQAALLAALASRISAEDSSPMPDDTIFGDDEFVAKAVIGLGEAIPHRTEDPNAADRDLFADAEAWRDLLATLRAQEA